MANGYPCDSGVKREYGTVVEVAEDRDLPARMERGVFYRKGSPLTAGAEKIRDALFGMRARKRAASGRR